MPSPPPSAVASMSASLACGLGATGLPPAWRRVVDPVTGTLGVVPDDPNPIDDLAPAALGPNAWLVDEMHEQYLADPTSVNESWQDFFADYRRDAAPQV